MKNFIQELQELIRIDFYDAIPDFVAKDSAIYGGSEYRLREKYKRIAQSEDMIYLLNMLGYDSYEEYADENGLLEELRAYERQMMNDAHAICEGRLAWKLTKLK